MENISNIPLPHKKCMKCLTESSILLKSCSLFNGFTCDCDHKFCISCFRKENTIISSSSNCTFNCPCCHASFYEYAKSIDEAILVCEASTLSVNITLQLFLVSDTTAPVFSVAEIRNLNSLLIEKLEAALLLNPTNFDTLYLLVISCSGGHRFLVAHNQRDNQSSYSVQIYLKSLSIRISFSIIVLYLRGMRI